MIEIQPPSCGPFGRLARSCAALAAPEAGLPTALTESVGLPAPFGPLANRLVVRTLEILDAFVPIGTVKFANDLVAAARDLGQESLPSIPDNVAAAQAHITAMVSHLTATELRDAATHLGVRPGTIARGARIVTLRAKNEIRDQAAELLTEMDFDDAGYSLAGDPGPESDHGLFSGAVATIVGDLKTRQPLDWDSARVAALRCAVVLHLSEIGDVFLHASEEPAH